MGRPIFACSLPGGAIRPSSAAQKYQHGTKVLDETCCTIEQFYVGRIWLKSLFTRCVASL